MGGYSFKECHAVSLCVSQNGPTYSRPTTSDDQTFDKGQLDCPITGAGYLLGPRTKIFSLGYVVGDTGLLLYWTAILVNNLPADLGAPHAVSVCPSRSCILSKRINIGLSI